ncbi:MAG: ABC transporter permease [Chloroflexota bacterium]
MASASNVKKDTGFNFTELVLSREGNILRLLIIVVLLFTLFSILRSDTFPTVGNMRSMMFQASEIGILALGVALTMLTGGIDLSINSTANLVGILAGTVLTAMIPEGAGPGTVAFAVIVALAVGTLTGLICGLFNGFLVAVIQIPAILATLGTLILYEGIGTAITDGASVFAQEALSFAGNGDVIGIPVPLILLLAATALLTFVLNNTRYGFEVYLLGTNPKAAKFSGINSTSVLIRTYAISGLLSALAGIVVLGRINAASVDFGSSYVLLAVLIAVLGGVDPYGGSGRLVGVLLALVALQFLSTGLNMVLFQLSGANFFKEFAWGGLLLGVLLLNHYIDRRNS